jgi:hypothetical protein
MRSLATACLLAASFAAFAAPLQEREIQQLIGRGQQALAAGRPGEAALFFERVVMEQPWRLGVWLDYALALQQAGDRESAKAIYRRLVDENPPEHLRPWLARQIQDEPAGIGSWRTAGQLTLLTGRDSNLNRAPALDSLILTLPTGPAVFPLAGSARASSGTVNLANAGWMAAHQSGEGEDWLVHAVLSARSAPGVVGQDYLQAQAGVMRRWSRADAEEWLGAVSLRHLRYGGAAMQQTLRIGLYRGTNWPDGGCASHVGGEWDVSAYPVARLLDSHYLGMAADIGCVRVRSWQVQMRAGMDKARHSRAGGDQWQFELNGQLGGQFGAARWVLAAAWRHQRDAYGYSSLLANNAVRRVQMLSFKAEYLYPLFYDWQGVVGVESFHQNSNLELFCATGKTGWLGLRKIF